MVSRIVSRMNYPLHYSYLRPRVTHLEGHIVHPDTCSRVEYRMSRAGILAISPPPRPRKAAMVLQLGV